MKVPIEICEQRDPKGLYKKARAGQIKNFTGGRVRDLSQVCRQLAREQRPGRFPSQKRPGLDAACFSSESISAKCGRVQR